MQKIVTMAVQNFLSQLKRQVSFHRLGNDVRTEDDALLYYETNREIDGFLLVEEKTKHCQTLQDPAGFPSYSTDLFAGTPEQTTPLPGGGWCPELVPAFPGTFQSPVSDVPMDLHPSIKTQENVDSIFKSVDLQVKPFNWAKYSYNFTSEELYLRDIEYKNEHPPG